MRWRIDGCLLANRLPEAGYCRGFAGGPRWHRRYLISYNTRGPNLSLDWQTPDQDYFKGADTDDGDDVIEAEIHLAKRPDLFKQTEPALDLFISFSYCVNATVAKTPLRRPLWRAS